MTKQLDSGQKKFTSVETAHLFAVTTEGDWWLVFSGGYYYLENREPKLVKKKGERVVAKYKDGERCKTKSK